MFTVFMDVRECTCAYGFLPVCVFVCLWAPLNVCACVSGYPGRSSLEVRFTYFLSGTIFFHPDNCHQLYQVLEQRYSVSYNRQLPHTHIHQDKIKK